MFEANFDGIRSLVVGLSAVMLFGGCFPTDDEEMGEQGKVLFHVIGDYSGTATLSEAPFCVDCAVFLELSDPSVGQNSLLADLKLSVEPSDAGEVIRLNGGRVLLVPHKAGEFKLVAKRDGLALDWLTLHAAETASMSLVDGTRWTERWDGSSYQLRRESVDIDSQLSLGTNQWLGVTLLPQDKDGNVLRGIVDFTVPSGSEERLVLEATLAASQGQRANRLTIRPKGSATGPIVLKLIDSVTGLSRTVSLDLTGQDEALPEG